MKISIKQFSGPSFERILEDVIDTSMNVKERNRFDRYLVVDDGKGKLLFDYVIDVSLTNARTLVTLTSGTIKYDEDSIEINSVVGKEQFNISDGNSEMVTFFYNYLNKLRSKYEKFINRVQLFLDDDSIALDYRNMTRHFAKNTSVLMNYVDFVIQNKRDLAVFSD